MPKNGRFDSAVQTYAWGVIRWRWLILLATVLLVAAAASGGRFVWFNTDYRAFFSEENPQLNSFDELQNVYGKNDNVLFVLAPAGGDVFTASVLGAVEHLTEQSWQIPFSIRVDSVTNFQHTRAVGDDLFVADLVSNALSKPPEVLQEVRKIALDEPCWSTDSFRLPDTSLASNVTLHFAEKSLTEVPDVAAHARRLAEEIRTAYPDVEVYLTGLSMLNNAFAEASLRDMQTLVPLMYLAMFLIMFWLLRSVSGTFGTLLIVAFSSLSAIGLTGWSGTGMTPPTVQAPTMIMTLAVADSIHLLVTMLQEMRNGRGKQEAIVESLRINFQPVFLTSLTTAIGFLTMNFSDAPPFQHLGNITATASASPSSCRCRSCPR